MVFFVFINWSSDECVQRSGFTSICVPKAYNRIYVLNIAYLCLISLVATDDVDLYS